MIGDSLTSIGPAAFHGCRSPSSIIFLNSVTRIESDACRDCDALSGAIRIPETTALGVNVLQRALDIADPFVALWLVVVSNGAVAVFLRDIGITVGPRAVGPRVGWNDGFPDEVR